MAFDELQGYVESLDCLAIQQLKNILVLMESLVQAKDRFDAKQVKFTLRSKVSVHI